MHSSCMHTYTHIASHSFCIPSFCSIYLQSAVSAQPKVYRSDTCVGRPRSIRYLMDVGKARRCPPCVSSCFPIEHQAGTLNPGDLPMVDNFLSWILEAQGNCWRVLTEVGDRPGSEKGHCGATRTRKGIWAGNQAWVSSRGMWVEDDTLSNGEKLW